MFGWWTWTRLSAGTVAATFSPRRLRRCGGSWSMPPGQNARNTATASARVIDARGILDATLGIEAPARAPAYLYQACAGDSALRAPLAGLLEMQGRLGSFLEPPKLAAATIDQPLHERAGTVIGPYKLMEEIG